MKIHTMKTLGRRCGATLAVMTALLAAPATAQPYNCLPTCAENDGRFLVIAAGADFSTLSDPILDLTLVVPAGTSSFEIGIFDGDALNNEEYLIPPSGGTPHWDTGKAGFPFDAPTPPPIFEYTVFADPGNNVSGTQVVAGPFVGTSLPGTNTGIRPECARAGFPPNNGPDPATCLADQAWFDIPITTGPEAQTATGDYVYRLRVELVNADVAIVANSFKVRTTEIAAIEPIAQPFGYQAPLTTSPAAFADLTDEEILYPSGFPGPSTYDGEFSFFIDAQAPQAEISVWDGDFDRGKFDGTDLDTNDFNTPDSPFEPIWATIDTVPEGIAVGTGLSTGDPADDFAADPSTDKFLRQPSVFYDVIFPGGTTFTNSNASGNQEWEVFNISATGDPTADATTGSLPAGAYELKIQGVDLANLNFLLTPFRVLCAQEDGTVCVPPPPAPFVVGDTVFDDLDGDGTQQVGEPGIPGVIVNLLGEPGGNVIATTVTDSSGDYSFPVNPAAYTVEVASANLTAPAAAGAIGDTVWYDVDGNGLEGVDPGISNVTLQLWLDGGDLATDGADDTLVATAVTDLDGHYLFDGLADGDYWVDVVDFTLPDDLSLSGGSDPSVVVTISGGNEIGFVDFGYTNGDATTAAVGNFVWIDDGDGIQEEGEAGIGDVTLELRDAGTNALVAKTRTGADGAYLFTGVAAGSYVIDVTDTAGILSGSGLVLTLDGAGGDPELDSQTDPSASFTLAGGDLILGQDFGYLNTALADISDRVWFDADRDGTDNGGSETGIAGVTVNLLGSQDKMIASTTTAGDGSFTFADLPDGTYTLGITDLGRELRDGGTLVPYLATTSASARRSQSVTLAGTDVSGVNFGWIDEGALEGSVGTTDDGDGDVDRHTGTVVAADVLDFDFGYLSSGLFIGDRIFEDSNSNGMWDSGEGIDGVDVRLTSSEGTVIFTTTSDGFYKFDGLTLGVMYTVTVLEDGCTLPCSPLPTNLLQTVDPDSACPGGGCDNETAKMFMVGDPPADLTLDFGYVLVGSLGDVVFRDGDGDGDPFEPGDIGLPGVTVELYDATDTILLDLTITGLGGVYSFDDLPAGTYVVRVDPSAPIIATPGLVESYDLDGIGTPHKAVVVLAAGENRTDVDFGYKAPPLTVGDLVFEDNSGVIGVFDGTDAGIPGVLVNLIQIAPPGPPPVPTTTGPMGDYLFLLGSPGLYRVEIDPSNFLAGGPLEGRSSTTGGDFQERVVGATDLDFDFGYDAPAACPDRVGQDLLALYLFEEGAGTLVGDSSGFGAPLDLTIDDLANVTWIPGDGISVDAPAIVQSAGAATKVIDAVKLSNEITLEAWIRVANETQSGPARIVSISQDPYQRNTTLGQEKDEWVARLRTTTTGSNGLSPQTVTSSDAAVAGQLQHLVYTRDAAGVGRIWVDGVLVETNTGIGGDLTNWDDGHALALANELTEDRPWLGDIFLVAIYGQALSAADIGVNLDSDLCGGIGGTGQGRIGDRLWFDEDGEGDQDAGEFGINGVTVRLLDAGGTEIATDVTDGDGFYAFEMLPPGTFTVEVVAATLPAQAGAPTFDWDGTATPNTAVVTLAPLEVNNDVDFGWEAPAGGLGLIGDRVWDDTAGTDGFPNGIQDSGEPGIADVLVNLLDAGGTVIATTTTNSSGIYRFDLLTPDTYSVQVDPSNFALGGPLFGHTATQKDAGGDDAFDSDGSTVDFTTDPFLLGSGLDSTRDFGFYRLSSFEPDCPDTAAGGFEIELLGTGMGNGQGPTQNPATLAISDPASVDRILAYVVVKRCCGLANPSKVILSSALETYELTEPTFIGRFEAVYAAYMLPTDSITAEVVTGGSATARGVAAWVFRRTANPFAVARFAPEFFSLYRSSEMMTVSIPAADGPRDIEVLVPVGDLQTDTRTVVVRADAGSFFAEVTHAMPNVGDEQLITSLVIEDVPGTVTELTITGTSPDPGGDSVILMSYGVNTLCVAGGGDLSGVIWEDRDGNGAQDGGEGGLAGVTVDLIGSGGVWSTAVTGADGSYAFTNLPAGTFTVAVDDSTLPGTDVPTFDVDGLSTPHTAEVTLAVGETRDDVDFGYQGSAGLGDRVWQDDDGDGVQDGGEPGLSGVTVELLGAGGALSDSMVTGIDGFYSFDNLAAGTYTVRVVSSTLPGGLGQTFDLDGFLDNRTAITLGDGEVRGDLDFGYAATGCPSRTGDGILALYLFNEGAGTTVADSSGVGLPIDLEIAHAGNVTWLSGGGLSVDAATIVQSAGAATKVTSGVQATNEITVEAWVRAANGSQGGPARMVTVSKDPYKRNVTLGQQGTKWVGRLRTTTTGTNGTSPETSTSAGQVAAAVLQHVVYTRDTAGVGRIYVDGVLVATNTNIGGNLSNWDSSYKLALANELSQDRAWLGEIHLVAIYGQALSALEVGGNRDSALCTGIGGTGLGRIGDRVWFDDNTDGVQDAGEAGINGVTVRLRDGGGSEIASAVTGGDGDYSFDMLPPGAYTVEVDASTLPSHAGAPTFDADGTGTPNTAAVTLAPQEVSDGVDFGYVLTGCPERVTNGILALYEFGEGTGTTVADSSGVGSPLDLEIAHAGNVTWLAGGGLSVDSATIVQSAGAATKVASGVQASDEITVEAWVRAANGSQGGPARMVTVSLNPYKRNVTLGQQSTSWVGRLRTTTTGTNGSSPQTSTSSGQVAAGTLQHVVYTRDTSGVGRIYVDGVLVETNTNIGGNLSNWDSSYKLALANELTQDRPWLGDFYLSAIYGRALSGAEIVQNGDSGSCNGIGSGSAKAPSSGETGGKG